MGQYMYNLHHEAWQFRALDPTTNKHVQGTSVVAQLDLPEDTPQQLVFKLAVREYVSCSAGFRTDINANPGELHHDMQTCQKLLEQLDNPTRPLENYHRRVRNCIKQLTPLDELSMGKHTDVDELRRLRNELHNLVEEVYT